MEQWAYPQYRCTLNKLHFYKILGEDRFIEVQVIGSKQLTHEVEAVQYPEKLRIQEMLEEKGFERCSEEEFNRRLIQG